MANNFFRANSLRTNGLHICIVKDFFSDTRALDRYNDMQGHRKKADHIQMLSKTHKMLQRFALAAKPVLAGKVSLSDVQGQWGLALLKLNVSKQ